VIVLVYVEAALRIGDTGKYTLRNKKSAPGVGHQPESPTGAQLHAGDLHVVVDAAHHHAFFATVELECVPQLKLQGHEGFDVFACIGAPGTDKVSDAALATKVAAGLDLRKQRACCASVLFGAQRRL
jgi:hypothetical protein